MYLRECLVRNVGPIESFDLSIASTQAPKPLVIVGPNGSGKSILLSYIADALFELAEQAFGDVIDAPQTNFRPYFRFVADSNQRSNTPYGVALLEFYEGQQRLAYAEKTGSVAPADLRIEVGSRFQGVREWSTQDHYKGVTQNKKLIESIFTKGVYCYFPSNRSEVPHWLNEGVLPKRVPSGLEPHWAGNLEKPIYVSSANAENHQWLLELFLDSMVDLEEVYRTRPADGSRPVDPRFEEEIGRRMYQAQGRRNIERILGKILRDEAIRLTLNPRHSGTSRTSILRSDSTRIPSLSHMSSGESLLFSLFATIARYADKSNLNANSELGEIRGIVIVDEIDAHLHVNLQYSVLPSLIKLFPGVQFIVTSHAPMFLLGMERELGADGFAIVEAPTGRSLPVEEFSEFKSSFEHYAETRQFDNEVQERVAAAANPIVLVEGQTDLIYLRTAIQLIEPELLSRVEIDWVGALNGNAAFNTGAGGLDHARNTFVANPQLLRVPLLLLYDCDRRKPHENAGLLRVRTIPLNAANAKVKRGIENLLPQELFEARFYSEKTNWGNYGEETRLQEFDKMGFCRWICQERRKKQDFAGFLVVIDFIRELLQ